MNHTWQTWHKSLAPWDLFFEWSLRTGDRNLWPTRSPCKLQLTASFWISSRNSCFISSTPPWKCLVASQLNQDGLFRTTSANLCKVQRFTCSTSSSRFNSRWLCWSGTSYGDSGLAIAPVDGGTRRWCHPSLQLECCLWDTVLKIEGQTWPSFKVEGMLYASACNKRDMICIHSWYRLPILLYTILMFDCN